VIIISYNIDLELMEKEFPVRKIASYDKEWWDEFKSEIQFRGYKVRSLDDKIVNINRKFKKIRLNYLVNNNDIWVYLKFKSHPYYTLLGAGMVIGTIIFLCVVFFGVFTIFGDSLHTSGLDDILINSFQPFIPFIIIFIAMSIVSFIFQNFFNKVNPLPNYSKEQKDLHEIKKTIKQSADKIKRKYLYSEYKIEKIKAGVCPNCGEKISVDWKICPICRENLRVEDQRW